MSGSNQTWKTIILAIALAAIVAWAAALPQVVEIARTQQTYGLGIAGSHDVQETGSRAIVIDALVPDGPLALAGVAVGDRISLEPDEIRLFVGNPQDSDGIRAGQEVGIVVDRAGETRHLKVTPALLPYRADFLFVNTSFFALSPIVLVFGLLVGFRQPNGIAYRALALSFLARGLSAALGDPTYLPPGVPGAVSSASVILGPASYLFMILFALSYHGAEPFGRRSATA